MVGGSAHDALLAVEVTYSWNAASLRMLVPLGALWVPFRLLKAVVVFARWLELLVVQDGLYVAVAGQTSVSLASRTAAVASRKCAGSLGLSCL